MKSFGMVCVWGGVLVHLYVHLYVSCTRDLQQPLYDST